MFSILTMLYRLLLAQAKILHNWHGTKDVPASAPRDYCRLNLMIDGNRSLSLKKKDDISRSSLVEASGKAMR